MTDSKWIPVGERLPNDKDACLVTVIIKGGAFVRPAYFVGDIVEGGWLLEHDTGSPVIAWMLYPEPYRPD